MDFPPEHCGLISWYGAYLVRAARGEGAQAGMRRTASVIAALPPHQNATLPEIFSHSRLACRKFALCPVTRREIPKSHPEAVSEHLQLDPGAIEHA